ncbi:hypothetical protein H6G93_29645 [Nostoc sp. FACHB-973]|nr:hypothetical protein [Nostoc sp. FACHB-973]
MIRSFQRNTVPVGYTLRQHRPSKLSQRRLQNKGDNIGHWALGIGHWALVLSKAVGPASRREVWGIGLMTND